MTSHAHQALQIDRERERLTAIGLRGVRPLTVRARVAGIRAYKQGADVGAAVRAVLTLAVPQITDGMTAAHLQGLLRAQITGKRAMGDRLALADPYRAALDFTQRRLDLTDADLEGLQTAYGQEAAKVIGDLSGHASGIIDKAVVESVRSGEHVASGVARLRQAFDAAGIGGADGAPDYALETLYRTQTQMGYGAGNWQGAQDPAVQEILWGYGYVTVGDDRVRPSHAALDGFKAPKDDPAWQRIWCPNGWCCRCTNTMIFTGDEDAGAFGSLAPVIGSDGETVIPGPDPGFEFNAGALFGGLLTV